MSEIMCKTIMIRKLAKLKGVQDRTPLLGSNSRPYLFGNSSESH